uniref:DEAD/DEAH box helicase domain-containing protein n=1 Tax=Araucaria cunninghamii TaxID=56994 RepID=A0A0D6R0X0_ARACU
MLELSNNVDHSIQNLAKHVKAIFGSSWKDVLCEGNILEGNVAPGSPAILIISSSAVRCVEVLRGLRELTTNCHAAKLFAKHIKMEEQVSMLKGRVNIAGGTPSRIKNLIDIEALGISRLSVLVLDMHKDAKGQTLFTLPQVSNQFWELYRTHFHKQVILGKLRLCLY